MLPLHRIVSITVDGDDIAVELDPRTRSRLPRPLSAIRTEAPLPPLLHQTFVTLPARATSSTQFRQPC